MIQQRVNEAADKIKAQSNEEKQRLLMDASKQMRDAVAGVKAEMESKFQQAQAVAVQEALKENNTQSSSKEVRVTVGALGVCAVLWRAYKCMLCTYNGVSK